MEAESRIGAIAHDLVGHYIDQILPNGFKAQVRWNPCKNGIVLTGICSWRSAAKLSMRQRAKVVVDCTHNSIKAAGERPFSPVATSRATIQV